jgi:pimeloyl-ACP methyl ester carboxylesterase
MPIPEFTALGLLPPGLHEATITELNERFGFSDQRRRAIDSIRNLYALMSYSKATGILLGGSFLTNREFPGDIDIVVIFKRDADIPAESLSLDTADAMPIDLFFGSTDRPDVIGMFVSMFSRTRIGESAGLLLLTIKQYGPTKEFRDSDDALTQISKIMNAHRRTAEAVASPRPEDPIGRPRRPRALILVHGLMTHGDWYSHVTEISSARGWIVAPYSYGKRWLTTLFRPSEQRKILAGFRDYVFDIQDRYKCDVSVISHSYGCVVAASYLYDFDPPVKFDTLILTGSLLSRSFDLRQLAGRVGRIMNEVGPNDPALRFADFLHPINSRFGSSGRNGFEVLPPFVTERRSAIFDHASIHRDVFFKYWLPELEANSGSMPW